MKYGSVCSGIEAATAGWHPLGWEPQFFSEIEKFPSAALAHHYPDVINHGDMEKYNEWPETDIDVLVGGTPCQSFSVAGLRQGMADPRGNLALTYLGIADRFRPTWVVWENVPGVLSSEEGRDFGSFLGGLAELGYGWAYRILDAQYFGVPQRRRRVFVVGHLGDWRLAAAVLFEREGLLRHPAPSREQGERVAPGVTGGAPFRGTGNERIEAEAMIPENTGTLTTNTGPNGHDAGNFASNQAVDAGYIIPETAHGHDVHAIASPVSTKAKQDRGDGSDNLVAGTLATSKEGGNLASNQAVDAGHIVAAPLGNHHNRQDLDTSTYISEVSPAIKARDHKGPSSDGVGDGAPIIGFTHNAGFEAAGTEDISPTMKSGGGGIPAIAIQATSIGRDDEAGPKGPGHQEEVSFTLGATDRHAVAVHENQEGEVRLSDDAPPLSTGGGKPGQGYPMIFEPRITRNGRGTPTDVVPALTAGADSGDSTPHVMYSIMPQNSGKDYKQGGDYIKETSAVRRLTPRECERLQGFPDDFTQIPWRGKPAEDCPDGPRYRALGNSMAVPVMRWIGGRIQKVVDF